MKYLFFDIECSNCFNGVGKMCEFGYVITDENFNIIKMNEIPMSPGRGEGNRFHLRDRMKQSDVELAYDYDFYFAQPEFPHYYELIKKLIENPDTICFAWSSDNDMLHLYHSCTRYKKEPFKYICYDLQKIAGHYLEVSGQKGLKNCCLNIVGRNSVIPLHEHLSRDDAKMTMMIFQAICVLEKKTSKEVLDESNYAKDDAYEYCQNFEAKKALKNMIRKNHEYYKQVVEQDKELAKQEEYVGKRIILSGDLKSTVNNLKEIIDQLHSKGYVFVTAFAITDLFVCSNEDNQKELEEKLKDKYQGKFTLLKLLDV